MESPEHDYVFLDESDITGSDRAGLQPLSLEKQQKIRIWLQPTDYSADSSEYMRHLLCHVQGTSKWLQEPQYQQWISSIDQGALWAKGIPGAGKSVVAAHLASQLQKAENSPVLYFFFRQIIASNRTPNSLLRDWMSQLLEYSPSLQWKLNSYLDRSRSLESVAFDELWDHLGSVLCNLRRVYCIADALDEMTFGNDLFIEKLTALGRLKPACVKVFMTSRPLPQIESSLRHEHKITLSKTLVDQDIVIYIQHRLRLANLPEDVWGYAQERLMTNSQGSFLYTKLTVDDLLESIKYDLSSSESVHEALDGIPLGLAEKYTSILSDYSARTGVPQSLQLTILRWIIHSYRPLRLLEVAAMVDSLLHKIDLGCDVREGQNRRNTKSIIRGACGPLIEILEDETVSIIHHSFTEYLIDPDRALSSKGISSFPTIDSQKSHLEIALACLRYLTSVWTNGLDLEETNSWSMRLERETKLTAARAQEPFLSYASNHWAYHVSHFGEADEELFQAIDDFLLNDSKALASWPELREGKSSETQIAYCEGSSALHLAAGEGLAQYTGHLLGLGQVPDLADERSQTPMHHAAATGSAPVIQMLLSHGANPEPEDDHGRKPLHLAALRNHPSVVETLLKAGVNPRTPKTREAPGRWCGNAPSTRGDTPLMYAFEFGHIDAALAFLPFLDPEAVSQALSWATKAGKTDLVSAVLDKFEVDVNKVTDGKTLLFLAAHQHDLLSMRKLLSLGADSAILSNSVFSNSGVRCIGYDDECSATPLHAMAKTSYRGSRKVTDRQKITDVLRLLLDSGCHIDAVDASGSTPLHLAAGKPCIALELLRNGANPSAVRNGGSQPLHLATSDGPLVHALVQHGADVDAANPHDGKTALHYAVQDPQMDRFLALLECKADCSAQDRWGNTPLHLAVDQWSRSGAQTKALLQNGADPNIKNIEGKTPLHCVTKDSTLEEILPILLSAGANVESRMRCGKTFFMQYMSRRRSDSLTTLPTLLKAGCQLDARDYEGRTVLHLLCTSPEAEPSVRALVREGADPFAVDFAGNTLLHYVARQTPGYDSEKLQKLLKLLVELKLDVDARNNLGQTAFYAAAATAEGSYTDKPGPLAFLTSSQCNSDVNTADHGGVRPIHAGAIIGEQRIRWLLRRGADPFALTNEGKSALHVAAGARESNVVGLLLELYISHARLDFIDLIDECGRTALHYACRSGRIESVQVLLDFGADLKIVDSNNRSPLDACAEFAQNNYLSTSTNQGGFVDAAYVPPDHSYGRRTHMYSRARSTVGIHSELDSVGIRYIVRRLIASGADISTTIPQYRTFGLDSNRPRNAHLDVARAAGCQVFLEELLLAIEKAEQGMEYNELGKPSCRYTSPYELYLEQYFCMRAKQSYESLNDVVKPDESNSEVFQALLQHEDENGVVRFRDLGADLLAPTQTWLDSPLTTLVKYGYADLLAKIGPNRVAIDRQLQSTIEKTNASYLNLTSPLLHTACERALPNLEVIKVLIEKMEFDVNGTDTVTTFAKGGTALHILARSSHWWHPKAVEYLIKQGAGVNIPTSEGLTPLHVAVKHNARKVVEILLRRGANPNLLAGDGTSCLNKSRLGEASFDSDVVYLLLEHGANGTVGKRPFLFDAIEAMNSDIVSLLVHSHADCNALYAPAERELLWGKLYEKPERAIHLAGSENFNTKALRPKMTPIIESLLTGGGDPFEVHENNVSILHDLCENYGIVEPFLKMPGIDLEARDCHGRTLFLAACCHSGQTEFRGHTEDRWGFESRCTSAVELSAHGADLEAVDKKGKNALHHVLADCSAEIDLDWNMDWSVHRNFELLVLSASAAALIAQRDQDGMTALLYAAESATFEFLDILLAKGADPLATNNAGNTVLHFLAPHITSDKKTVAVFQRFLDLGLAINVRNKCGETPLFLYLSDITSRLEGMQFFLQAEADLLTTNIKGQGLLHVVAEKRVVEFDHDRDAHDHRLEIFKSLMKHRLDTTKEDNDQRTPVDLAVAARNKGILALFRRET